AMPPAARPELTYQPPAQPQHPVPMAQELRPPQRENVTTDLTQDQPRREYPQRAYALHEREHGHGTVQDMVTRDVVPPTVTHEQPIAQAPAADNRLAAVQQQGDFVPVRHELDRSTYQVGSDTLRFRETGSVERLQDPPQRPAVVTETVPTTPAQPTVIVKS